MLTTRGLVIQIGTNFSWPCRGTKETCQYNNVLTTANEEDGDGLCRPTDDCCWRYSFRHQLEEAKATGGYMLQLIEKPKDLLFSSNSNNDDDDGQLSQKQELGLGQQIELDMSKEISLKVFQIYRPTLGNVPIYGSELSFNDSHIHEVVTSIQRWYDNNQEEDDTVVVIRFGTLPWQQKIPNTNNVL